MGKVYSPKALSALRAEWKREGRTVVFTNGVFDILHRGHVEYLSAAKRLGDVLVVGVNTDASVRRLKGPLRPVVTQDDRAYILSQLVSVDAAVLFDEDTPLALITSLVPDVLVKGADYAVENIVGREVVEKAGGTVRTIEFVPDRSTTGIVETVLARFGAK
ncbi:MAG: D-glycero-beta-D-manno-heptose 1-phosphate adenylyltransferase [Bacteroidetes bacterium]|nr:MAG: D-glycero-beta-D-manno-heptose 1-phosphate adenylyltransferase [Bacteroidota bacterium]